jgi:hypothetical protein
VTAPQTHAEAVAAAGGSPPSWHPVRPSATAADTAERGTMQPEPITEAEFRAELDRLRERREELEEKETTLAAHDHGGGLPADDQNRLDRVRGELADVLQDIGDLKDRYADANGGPVEPDGALGE